MPASESERAHPVIFCGIAGGAYGGVAGGLVGACFRATGSSGPLSASDVLFQIILFAPVGFAVGAFGGFFGGLIAGMIADIFGFIAGGALGGLICGGWILVGSPQLGYITGSIGAVYGLIIGYFVFYKPVSWMPVVSSLHDALVFRKDPTKKRLQQILGWGIVVAFISIFVAVFHHSTL